MHKVLQFSNVAGFNQSEGLFNTFCYFESHLQLDISHSDICTSIVRFFAKLKIKYNA